MLKSPPSRGAWIEIRPSKQPGASCASPPSRGAWIEIPPTLQDFVGPGRPPRGGRGLKSRGMRVWPPGWMSPPSRGAWIEIYRGMDIGTAKPTVAPLAGGVD